MSNSNLPLVTIMIPTYNQEIYLPDAIESALGQDYQNLEIIVTDDCSTDNTPEIIKKYLKDKRFKYIRNKPNLGRVGNYHNTLYNHATGEWIINLDGDDYFSDMHFISRAISRIRQHENIVCYYGNKNLKPEINKCFSSKRDGYYVFNGINYFLGFFSFGSFTHALTLYKRSVVLTDKKCYTFNGIQSDFHGLIRYAILGNVIVAQDDSYVWRIHDNNATNSISCKAKYKSERKCQLAIIKDLPFSIDDNKTMQWLEEGRKSAHNRYLIDSMNYNPSIKSILAGISNYRFSISYTIVVIKSCLRCLGLKVKI